MIYYHNITKKIFNESDLEDFLDDFTEGDDVRKTVSGNAIVERVSPQEFQDMLNQYAELKDGDDDEYQKETAEIRKEVSDDLGDSSWFKPRKLDL